MGKWIDISMAVTDGLRSNHSKPGEEVRITCDVTPETDPARRKTVRRISTRLHTGTHVDGPEHLVLGAKRLDSFPMDRFTGSAVVVDMCHKVPKGIITADDLEATASDCVKGDILILRTGWNSRYTESDFFSHSPYFDPEATTWCINRGLKMVAVDFLCDPIAEELQVGGPDAFKTRLLAADVLVMTNADNLDQIKARRVTLYAFPLKVVPSEAAPTRAVVWEE